MEPEKPKTLRDYLNEYNELVSRSNNIRCAIDRVKGDMYTAIGMREAIEVLEERKKKIEEDKQALLEHRVKLI